MLKTAHFQLLKSQRNKGCSTRADLNFPCSVQATVPMTHNFTYQTSPVHQPWPGFSPCQWVRALGRSGGRWGRQTSGCHWCCSASVKTKIKCQWAIWAESSHHLPSVTHVVIDPSLPEHCNPTKIEGLKILSQEPVPWLLWMVSVVALLKMLLIQANCTEGEIPPNTHSLRGSVCKW